MTLSLFRLDVLLIQNAINKEQLATESFEE